MQVVLRRLLIIFLIIKAGGVYGQSALETKALKELSRYNWTKCKDKFTRVLSKDSLSVGGHYIKALYYSSENNPDINLDTAYNSLGTAMFYYDELSLRQRERLARFPLDSFYLRKLRQKIDSAAFVRARNLDTEESYLHFLEHFPSSVNYGDAILLLHDAAYKVALEENTYASFEEFLKKYPDSRHSQSAKDNYDRLLFYTSTRDKRLATYQKYVRENPRSPYRRNAEEQIFEISTATGDQNTFIAFINNYPDSPSASRARNILYYLLKDSEGMLEYLMTDSLRSIHQLNQAYLVPIFSAGHFGFMDSKGEDVISPASTEIVPQYLCGNITEDVLVVDDKLVSRNGSVIFEGSIDEIDDIGLGFLFVSWSDGSHTVIHKSGFSIAGNDTIEDVHILDGRFIALKIKEHWALYSLSGRLILIPEWDEIKTIGEVLALRKNDDWRLLTYALTVLIADQQLPDFSMQYDDVKKWPAKNLIWAKRNGEEALLDSNLNVLFPFENRELKPLGFGFEARSDSSVRIFDYTRGEVGEFQNIVANSNWLGVKVDSTWQLFDPSSKHFLSKPFDSISFAGIFALGYRHDSVTVFFDRHKNLAFKNAKIDFLAGKDSSTYLVVINGDRRSLFDIAGKKLFDFNFDKIEPSEKGLFIVSKKGKKGLVSGEGKILLPAVYDAIGYAGDKYLSLLRETKFGLYDLKNRIEIKPAYEKNLREYNQQLIIGYKGRTCGIIDTSNKIIIPFEYENIQYWNDTAAFVQKNSLWQLLEIKTKKIVTDQIKTIAFVTDTPAEKVAIAQENNAFGVISSSRGIVLPFSFTDIVNVGSKEDPLYFTEKHVEEAQIFVIIYYDKNGRLLRRQVFEPEEYEKIYCSNN